MANFASRTVREHEERPAFVVDALDKLEEMGSIVGFSVMSHDKQKKQAIVGVSFSESITFDEVELLLRAMGVDVKNRLASPLDKLERAKGMCSICFEVGTEKKTT